MQHRDLKDSNILLVIVDGVLMAKISDFGMSEIKSESVSSTKGFKGGTFKFSAPETFESKFSEKSDVWSYYMIAYKLATFQVSYFPLRPINFFVHSSSFPCFSKAFSGLMSNFFLVSIKHRFLAYHSLDVHNKFHRLIISSTTDITLS